MLIRNPWLLFHVAVCMLQSSAVSARTLDIHVRGGQPTNDVQYGLNELYPVPYRQVEDVISAAARLDKDLRIRVFIDETVCVGSLAHIVRRFQDLGLRNFALIARSVERVKFPYTPIVGDDSDLLDDTPGPPQRGGTPQPVPATAPNGTKGNTSHRPRPTETLDRSAGEKQGVRPAAPSDSSTHVPCLCGAMLSISPDSRVPR
jgi:hypothetical protein